LAIAREVGVRDVVLALLAKGPAHGYELRQRLAAALGPLGSAVNRGQVYVTLGRLERAGLVTAAEVGQAHRPDRRVYELSATKCHVGAGTGPKRRPRPLTWALLLQLDSNQQPFG
jgi:hypothetical protein